MKVAADYAIALKETRVFPKMHRWTCDLLSRSTLPRPHHVEVRACNLGKRGMASTITETASRVPLGTILQQSPVELYRAS
ncbi:hypothetical protein PoB_007404200 [Plakobranchus ocellatus]|uniref:Uncharacterized protein n=1 Tax=Plakobranchus ocellatus TaxID=259542 RepID=A0AAV4DT79_9GAST|nr:hypothetical protein PoB_007404200 [Plakobranchus ocellatus]